MKLVRLDDKCGTIYFTVLFSLLSLHFQLYYLLNLQYIQKKLLNVFSLSAKTTVGKQLM